MHKCILIALQGSIRVNIHESKTLLTMRVVNAFLKKDFRVRAMRGFTPNPELLFVSYTKSNQKNLHD
jgi:hypothetical protein